MSRGARVLCVSFPFLTTAAAAALLVIGVFIGQTNSNSSFLDSLYFLRLDTRYIDAPNQLGPNNEFAQFAEGVSGINLSVQSTANLVGAADFYQAGLFSYCSGTYDNATGSWNVQNCSSPSASFVFNIVNIINSQAHNGQNLTFPNEVNDYFKAVASLTRAQYICFIVGIIATGAEILLGFFGFLSRWGSCATTIVASFAFLANLAAAAINTGLYAALGETFDKTYKTFGVKGTLNKQTYALMWIGVLLSFIASLFWMFSTCCCSGHRDRIMKRDSSPSRGPKSYERVPSPYIGGGPAPAPAPYGYQQQYGQKEASPYEPMRHTSV